MKILGIIGLAAIALVACGHAHIDVAWLWPLAQTRGKARRTFQEQHAGGHHHSDHEGQLQDRAGLPPAGW